MSYVTEYKKDINCVQQNQSINCIYQINMYLSEIRARRPIHFKINDFDIRKKPVEKDTWTKNARQTIHKYLKSTSMHGLSYVGDDTLTNLERVGFIFAFILVFCTSAYFITIVWEKWTKSPIIIGLNPVLTQIRDIPFPAVTICNMNQANKQIAIETPPYVVHAMQIIFKMFNS